MRKLDKPKICSGLKFKFRQKWPFILFMTISEDQALLKMVLERVLSKHRLKQPYVQ